MTAIEMLASVLVTVVIACVLTICAVKQRKYRELEAEILKKLGISSWNIIPYFDENVVVKSRQALDKYDETKFFKENETNLLHARRALDRKIQILKTMYGFLNDNEYKNRSQYAKIVSKINTVINIASAYRILVKYISPAGNHLGTKVILCINAI